MNSDSTDDRESSCAESYTDSDKGEKMADNRFRDAYREWSSKGAAIIKEHFGDKIPVHYLGLHAADVIADIVKTQQQTINAQNETIKKLRARTKTE